MRARRGRHGAGGRNTTVTSDGQSGLREGSITTGLPGLDRVLDGLEPGDNVVWRVDSVDDYREFVRPFVAAALESGRQVVYVRFAAEPPLLDDDPRIAVVDLDAQRGFESFTVRLHVHIAMAGPEAFYVFDCLSSLLDAWATDAMIGNFFAVTCPLLFDLETVAYFALLRDTHPFATVSRIRSTTQLLIDLYSTEGELYLHPLKVWRRSSPTMFLPHRRRGDSFVPITASYEASRLFMALHSGKAEVYVPLDHWERLFLRASRLVRGKGSAKSRQAMVDEFCRLLFGSDERMLALARRFMTLEDFLLLKERFIGTGYVGGKAAGLLLARAILRTDTSHDWEAVLEPHDSFFFGSDLFHTYLVHNGWWRVFMEHKAKKGYFSGAAKLRTLLLRGSFPTEIRDEFQKLLEYYGQYPLIVRLSSLQEDGFGNAFAGKYGSYFCVNQGTPEERFCQFEEAVRMAYASTMSEDALEYRLQRGLDRQEEQMALVVQRVAGAYHGRYFFPDIAGVGFSYNTFVWDENVDPRAGMLRLVFGLGTRATARVEGDYTRIVSLDQPTVIPFGSLENARRFSQRQIDLLDIAENTSATVPISRLLAEGVELPEIFGSRASLPLGRVGRGSERLPTFDRFLADSDFAPLMRLMLATLEKAYNYPVDVEFTVTSTPERELKINLVQCRPLQTRGVQVRRVEVPAEVAEEELLFRSRGNFLGGSIVQPIRRVIQVVDDAFLALPLVDRYELARVIGRLNRLNAGRDELPTLLLAPGRIGTTSPEMGVPVRFAEIDGLAAIVEVAFVAGSLMPELSFGSHFFQDLVESGVFYVALYPERPDCILNQALLSGLPNRLAELLPDDAGLVGVLRVVDLPVEFRLMADIVSQEILCCGG